MPVTVNDIIPLMESIAPPVLAEKWDNSGLQLGNRQWPVRRVVIALDPSPEVITEAIRLQADLLVTHHPFLFTPLKAIDLNTPIGGMISLALEKRLAIYTAHTNFDSAAEGLNDMLARRLSLQHLTALQPSAMVAQGEGPQQGLGRVGALREKMPLRAFALQIKQRLSLEFLLMVGDPDLPVRRVALCTGSGSSLLEAFYATGAQVYVSGDLRYHDARTAEVNHVGLIDIGHFASEHLMVAELQVRLQSACGLNGISVEVQACSIEKNPFILLR